MLDFDASRADFGRPFFRVMQGGLARLQRALIQFMLDVHTEPSTATRRSTYRTSSAPDALFGTGQLPKFEDDQFKTVDEPPFYLIPTAEVPVTNLVRDSILETESLPLKFVAHTPCFRSEAGSHGKDTRGMIRQHQFEKVELVQIVPPRRIGGCSRGTDRSCRGHFAAPRTAVSQGRAVHRRRRIQFKQDLRPGSLVAGQGAYREISSCSNFRDFQARRMRARWRDPEIPANRNSCIP